MVPIFLGGLLAYLVERRHGAVGSKDESLRDRIHRPGPLFAAGLITREALMGIFIAIPIVPSGRADVLAIDRKSVVWGKSVSGRVDIGGRGFMKNKKIT